MNIAEMALQAGQWAAVMFGIGAVIFLHELGHFLAAKGAGVRVERFSLGFGPPILRRQRGETEYCISAIPFGGYVKMTGESDDPDNEDPRALNRQGALRRAWIFSAGVIMNALTAFTLFTLSFALGTALPAPEAGGVMLPSPAWRAGIDAGDRILAVDGASTMSFTDIVEAVAHNASADGLAILCERRGTLTPSQAQTLREQGTWDPDGTLRGWRGPAPWAPAMDLCPGDRLLTADGAPALGDSPVPPDGFPVVARRVRRVVPERNAAQGIQMIGITPPLDLRVEAVQAIPSSDPLRDAGVRPGDRLIQVDGAPVASPSDAATAITGGTASSAALLLERSGTLSPAEAARLLRETEWDADGRLSSWTTAPTRAPPLGLRPGDRASAPIAPAGGDVVLHVARRIPRSHPGALRLDDDMRILPPPAPVADAPASRAGIRPGDRIVSVNGETVGSWGEFAARVRDLPGTPVSIGLARGETAVQITATPTPRAPWRIGVAAGGEGTEIALVRPGRLADRLGLRPGDRFVESPQSTPEVGASSASARWTRDRTVRILREGVPIDLTLDAGAGTGDAPWEAIVADLVWAPRLTGVVPDGPAARAGLLPGDRIAAVALLPSERANDAAVWTPLATWDDLAAAIEGAAGAPLAFEVARGSDTIQRVVEAEPDTERLVGFLGIRPEDRLEVQRIPNPVLAFAYGVRRSVQVARNIPVFLARLFDRSERAIDVRNLGGVIMIAHAANRFAQWGVGSFLYFFGLVSVQLAALNLLPIPVLDGGHLLYLAIEKIKGSRVSDRTQAIGQYAGLVFLLFVLALTFYNDIARMVGR